MENTVSWEDFSQIVTNPTARRNYLYDADGKYKHVLFSQQFDRGKLDSLYETATAIRNLHKTKRGQDFLRNQLKGKRLLNLFVQPSTRTVESFTAAAEKLGMDCRVIQDVSTSSFAKGESLEDSIRTLSSYFDLIVTRNKEDDFALRAAYSTMNSKRPVPVISGGSGTSHHVTQSLLDIYTLQYSFVSDGNQLDGKEIMIVSDLSRNRAARSLIYLLTKFENINLVLVSPPKMAIDEDLEDYCVNKHNMKLYKYNSIKTALESHPSVDAIYMTRNQKEYKGSDEVDNWNEEDFYLKWEYRKILKNHPVIMHPLPRVNELPTEWDNYPTSVVWRQVRNGMWIRAALFAHIFGVDEKIKENYFNIS